MKKKLFHISLVEYVEDIEDFIDYFEPRIPTTAASNEDMTQERICTADTIDGCIKGHPNLLRYANLYMNWDPMDSMSKQMYLLEKGKSGFLCQLYEFDVDLSEDFIKTPDQLIGLVPDVNFTNEHWLTKAIEPSNIRFVLIEKAEHCPKNEEEANIPTQFEYTIFETVEELGSIVNCMDIHVHNEFLYKNFEIKKPYDIWTLKFDTKQVSEFLNVIAESEVYYDLQENIARYTQSVSPKNITDDNPFNF